MTGPATTAQTPFDAARGLTWLAAFGAFGVGVSVLYSTTGFGFGCLFRTLTGWDCPFCGGTRLGDALLHGDVAAAFAFNPLVFVGLLSLTGLGLLWIVEVAGGPRTRPPAWVSARIRRLSATHWLLVGGAVALGYVLLRNLL